MRGPFTRFVLELCKSKEKLREFERDPDRLIRTAGLSARQAEALKSRNSAEINKLIEQECGKAGGGGVKHVESGVKYVGPGAPSGVKKVEIIPERWIEKPSKRKSQKATRGKKAGKSRRAAKTKRA